MKQGDLVLVKINDKNVIGSIVYLIRDMISVQVDHTLKITRGRYLVSKQNVRRIS